jgi:hypothetical protein
LQPIFRTIEVGIDQRIELGQPLAPDVRALMNPSDPGATRLQMRIGTFGNAASITVDLAPTDMHVQQIEFTYVPGTEYAGELAAYTQMLGQPNHTDTVPEAQQSAVWNDTFTLFQLWSRGGSVGSRLENLLPT